jgi:hypothetical protein
MEPLEYGMTYTVTVTASINAGYHNYAWVWLTNPVTTEFTTQQHPLLTLDAVSPPSSTKNNTVTLSGTGFEPGNTDVLFNGVQGIITNESTDFINVKCPLMPRPET